MSRFTGDGLNPKKRTALQPFRDVWHPAGAGRRAAYLGAADGALHPHIHYLCPGGGLLLDGSGWRDVPTTGKKQRLVPLAVLRTRYRQLFLAGLKKLYAAGKLRLPGKLVALTDPAAFNAFVLRLDAVDWVVHCKGPPLGYGHSVAAMKYLAGYVRGTAICDARIVADDGEHVSFRVKEYRAGGTAAIEKIRGTEFVGRFLMHLLPPRLMRIRYYGMYSGRRRGVDIPRRAGTHRRARHRRPGARHGGRSRWRRR